MSPTDLCKALESPILRALSRFSQGFPQRFPQKLCKGRIAFADDARLIAGNVHDRRRLTFARSRIEQRIERFEQVVGEHFGSRNRWFATPIRTCRNQRSPALVPGARLRSRMCELSPAHELYDFYLSPIAQ